MISYGEFHPAKAGQVVSNENKFKQMKIKYINILLFIILMGAALPGCYEDLGNYDYRELNEVVIDTLDERFLLSKFDTLRIRPNIDQTIISDNDLSYEWEINYELVSTDRNLDYVVDFVKNNVPLRLKVTDNKSGVSYFSESSIDAVSYYSRGLFALHEPGNGAGELSFLRMYPENKGEWRHGVLNKEGFEIGKGRWFNSSFLSSDDDRGQFGLGRTSKEGIHSYTIFDVEFNTIVEKESEWYTKKVVPLHTGLDFVFGFGGDQESEQINQIHPVDNTLKVRGNYTYPHDISTSVTYIPRTPLLVMYVRSRDELTLYMKQPGGAVGRFAGTKVIPGTDVKWDMPHSGIDRNGAVNAIFRDTTNNSGQIRVYNSWINIWQNMANRQYKVPEGTFRDDALYYVSLYHPNIFYTSGNVLNRINTNIIDYNSDVFFELPVGYEITAMTAAPEEDVIYLAAYNAASVEEQKGDIYVIDAFSGELVEKYANVTGRVINLAYKQRMSNGPSAYVKKGSSAID